MSMSGIFSLIDKLASSTDSVPEDLPCKSEILAMRQCLESKGQDVSVFVAAYNCFDERFVRYWLVQSENSCGCYAAFRAVRPRTFF
jgi:hypothetical protein